MKYSLIAIAGALLLSNSAIAQPQNPTAAGISRTANQGVAELLSCLRKEEIPLIGAHRGGPLPEYPENAMATLQRTTEMLPVFLEIDIQQSFDDQLFLNHDPVLHRNMVGYGTISEMRWAQIAPLKLRDQSGQPTEYTAPLLKDVLTWADGRALLLLDVKPSTEAALLAEIVKSAGAEHKVMLLAYTIKQAQAIRELMPDTVIALPVYNREALEAAKAAGLVNDHLLAMARPSNVDDQFIPDLEALGATVMTASYRSAQSPDALYRTLEDASHYHALAAKGPRLIVSNRPHEAIASMLAMPDYAQKLAKCGIVD